MDWGTFGLSSGLGGIGAGLGSMLFGGNQKNPGDYLKQIEGSISPYLKPYSQAGQGALPQLSDIFSKLTNNPNEMYNKIGSGYQQSPGFQFSLQNALGAAGRGAAAGGMAGSPAHERTNMELATNLSNQDFNNYMDRALGLFGQGTGGLSNLANMGLGAGNNMAQAIAQALASQAGLQHSQNANQNQALGGLFGSIGSALPFFL